MYYIHKFLFFYTINYINKREKECPPCFQQGQWLSILKAVQKEEANQARALGVNLVNSHDNATEKDQELLSVVCIWDGTHKSADFFAMNKMLYHLVARCCEAAQQKKSTLHTTLKTEGYATFHCLSLPVERHKTSTYQKLQVFTHKTSCLMCIYFALAYKLVLDNGLDDYLFPDFAAKLGNKDDNKIDSKASALFNEYLRHIEMISKDYEQEVTYDGGFDISELSSSRFLTSHSVEKKVILCA